MRSPISLADKDSHAVKRAEYLSGILRERYWKYQDITADFIYAISLLGLIVDYYTLFDNAKYPAFSDGKSRLNWEARFVGRVLPEKVRPVILFVGSNPSRKAHSNQAFTEETASGRTLRSWIKDIECDFIFENLVPDKTPGNRPLNKGEKIQAALTATNKIGEMGVTRIVTLGKTAAEVLNRTGWSFFEMPHPSGLNRKLNDAQYLSKKLSELRRFCETGDTSGSRV